MDGSCHATDGSNQEIRILLINGFVIFLGDENGPIV